jgi:hypothetical protein
VSRSVTSEKLSGVHERSAPASRNGAQKAHALATGGGKVNRPGEIGLGQLPPCRGVTSGILSILQDLFCPAWSGNGSPHMQETAARCPVSRTLVRRDGAAGDRQRATAILRFSKTAQALSGVSVCSRVNAGCLWGIVKTPPKGATQPAENLRPAVLQTR